ncbi:MAG TPA: RNA polymerase sigma factor [Pseudonocardia sp.]
MTVTRDNEQAAHRTVEAVWRIEAARLIAGLARLVQDLGQAEELAQDALVAALEQWPSQGVPENPGGWLMSVAKRKAIDQIRRRDSLHRKHQQLGHDLETRPDSASDDFQAVLDAADGNIEDDLLRLIFTACHPVLTTEARVALTLRVVGGLTTAEIARAFLVSEPTIGQRIVRAKKALTKAAVTFTPPTGAEIEARLPAVLEVIYLVFNEGYSASHGDDWMRPALCEQALRLGRILAELVPTEPEAHGLVALMELQASRLRARTDAAGAPVLLVDQDRARWDRLLIGRGLRALERATRLGGARGRYALQAALASCHAKAASVEDTNWVLIAALYRELAIVAPSPVVELNRAVAVSMIDPVTGPAAGLALVDALADEPALRGYHLLPSVRGDLLAKLGRFEEARAELERAAALTGNEPERAMLLRRAAGLPA